MNIGAVQSSSAYYSTQNTSSTNNQQTKFDAVLQDRTSRLQEGIDSGKIDTAKLQEKLESEFGDAVSEFFGEDGSVDVEGLDEFMQSQMGSVEGGMPPGGMPPGGMPPGGMPPGGMPPGGMPPDGSESTDFTLDTEELQANLIEEFGEDAEGIVSEDGEIDVEKLKLLFEENSTSAGLSSSASFTPPFIINQRV